MNRDDWKTLRLPLLLLVAVVALAAGGHFYAQSLLHEARQGVDRQTSVLRAAETRLQKSGEEKEVIVRYLDRYRQLSDAGFIGEERRIAWLDALRAANQAVRLFGVDYHIDPQRPYAYASELAAPELVLRESTMKLNLSLLHEEDLPRFFATLARQNAGLFVLDKCAVRRLDPGTVLGYRPHLAADCELSWITATPARAEVKR